MKVKNYKNIVNYIQHKFPPFDKNVKTLNDIFREDQKGITICKAKKCNEPLYNNQSTSNKEYCMNCG